MANLPSIKEARAWGTVLKFKTEIVTRPPKFGRILSELANLRPGLECISGDAVTFIDSGIGG